MLSKTSVAYKQIKQHCHLLVGGTVLSIDPSMGSQSSLPGWAVYQAQELGHDYGTMDVPREGDHTVRLSAVRAATQALIERYKPDVVVIEEIPSAAGSFNLVSLASLHMARGAILSCVGSMPWVTILPRSWKPMARPDYQKGDAEDAVEIGWVVIQLAQRLLGESGAAKGRRKKSLPAYSRVRVGRCHKGSRGARGARG